MPGRSPTGGGKLTTTPTTERLTADDAGATTESYLIYLIHVATYRYCLDYVSGKKVLDYGCGTGYGTALISPRCKEVTGIDTSVQAIRYAVEHYRAPNLTFQQVSPVEVVPLPFADASFDVVLSLQVIEHVRNVNVYLTEISRVLAPGGCAIFSTPDRSSRLFPFQKPWNRWHLREYSKEGLRKVLRDHFVGVKVLNVGGSRDVIQIELNRTRALRWLTLPFTVPLMPEVIRIGGLRMLKALEVSASAPSHIRLAPAFDEQALRISEHEANSVDLVAVAQNA